MDLKVRLGLILRDLRLKKSLVENARHISQEEIAVAAQVSVRYYHDLENGKRMPTLEVDERIAKAYGMKLSEFCKAMEEVKEMK